MGPVVRECSGAFCTGAWEGLVSIQHRAVRLFFIGILYIYY